MAVQGAPLFGRVVTLIVGDRVFSDFHVNFNVRRTSRSKPSPAEIVISGLSQQTRDAISERLTPVKLMAGYQENAGIIFTGQLDSAISFWEPPQWQTAIHASDGRAAWEKYAQKSWVSGTPWQAIAQYLASAMGLQIGDASLAQITGTTRGAYAVDRYANREMDTLAQTLGLQWSIQDGAVQMVQADKSTQEQLIVISDASGLVGSVRFTDPKISRVGKSRTKRVRSAIEFDCLLLPDYKPGRRVQMNTLTCKGIYRIDSVQHHGDSHSGQLLSTIAASAITLGAT